MDARQRWIRRKGEGAIAAAIDKNRELSILSIAYMSPSGLTTVLAWSAMANYSSQPIQRLDVKASDQSITDSLANCLSNFGFSDQCYVSIPVDVGDYDPPWALVRSAQGAADFGSVWKLSQCRECLLLSEDQSIVVACFEEEHGQEIHAARFRGDQLEHRFSERVL